MSENMTEKRKANGSEKDAMRIMIVGCGKVGKTILEQLVAEGHDITVVDTNKSKIDDITNVYDIMGVIGNGASYEVQMEAGIEDTDLIIAVTASDELNLLCCIVATQVGHCAAIARVRTPDYSTEISYLQEKLGLAMIINPELEAAIQVGRILYMPSALEVNPFAHGQAEMVRFKIPEGSKFHNVRIMDAVRNTKLNALVCAVEREKEKEVVIPSGNFVLREGDIISFVTARRSVRAFLVKMGVKTSRIRNALVIGGGKAAYYLGKQLENMDISLKIIERDKARCDELSELLPNAIVINGDGTDPELLKEEGIETVDSFIPVTGIDEENIMLTLHARRLSNAKVITKINRTGFKNVINDLDLGSVIYPKYITSEAIIAYVRAKQNSLGSNVETLYNMFDNRAEAIEFRVEVGFSHCGKPIMELPLKGDLLICCINRNGKIIIPSGRDTMEAGDTVMIMTTHKGFRDLEDILQ